MHCWVHRSAFNSATLLQGKMFTIALAIFGFDFAQALRGLGSSPVCTFQCLSAGELSCSEAGIRICHNQLSM